MRKNDIKTEDGVILHRGDRAYNYYDMKPGVIDTDPDDAGWFRFKNDWGGIDILNGPRICTIEYAKRRGFPHLDN